MIKFFFFFEVLPIVPIMSPFCELTLCLSCLFGTRASTYNLPTLSHLSLSDNHRSAVRGAIHGRFLVGLGVPKTAHFTLEQS